MAIDFDPLYTKDAETFTPDDLISGETQLVTESITVITGENLVRGAVLGKITASGKYNLSLSAAIDGSEVPVAILGQDTDATAADVVSFAYIKGEFNDNAITVGTAHTVASIRDGLRSLGIFLKTPVIR